MGIRTTYSVFVMAMGLMGCIREDYFGYSDNGDILAIEFANQSGQSQIFKANDSVYIEVANGTDLTRLMLNRLSLSPFANAAYDPGDVLDFSKGAVTLSVTAESGLVSTWKISVYELGSQPQIDNSDFNVWHQQGSYMDPGVDDSSSAWGTSNPGAIFAGLDPNVQQLQVGDGNHAAKLTTRYTLIGSWVNKPIAAGSLFTGNFREGDINFDDPEASIDFGIPFTGMPRAFQVEYQYTPGPDNTDSHGNSLDYPDQGDMYLLLERREDDTVKRVATAWFRIAEGNGSMETVTVDLVYGELPFGAPEYMLPAPGEEFARDGETPTHVTVVFSSSANGNIFEGAENSVLVVDDFELIY